jgi:hypothetical protein
LTEGFERPKNNLIFTLERLLQMVEFISVVSPTISFIGLLLVVWQLHSNTKQRESESLVKIYDINRQLLSLGFSHPQLFAVLNDAKSADATEERYYLHLWLNQYSQVYTYLKRSIFRGELKESLERDLADFMSMANTQSYWQRYATFYPVSFQTYVNEIMKKAEPPAAAQPTPETNQDAKT